MNTARSGLLAAGTWIVDKTKLIDLYPAQDSLATIESEQRNNGGGAFNVATDLSRLGAPFPLFAAGVVGADAEGDWILEQCKADGIRPESLHRHPQAPTSYTDVMTVRSTGRRTFFHQPGANRFFAPEHFPIDSCPARILYIGYLLLLETLDAPDPEFGTAAAGVLTRAGEKGMLRVLDLVSVERADYGVVLAPSLRVCDVLICNELEAARATGIPFPQNDVRAGCRRAAEAFFHLGVRDCVVIHLPEGAFALGSDGGETHQPSVRVPPKSIRGTCGAGDAFAAGLLFGMHEDRTMAECLRLGVSVAAACLEHPTTSAGIVSLAECIARADRLGFGNF